MKENCRQLVDLGTETCPSIHDKSPKICCRCHTTDVQTIFIPFFYMLGKPCITNIIMISNIQKTNQLCCFTWFNKETINIIEVPSRNLLINFTNTNNTSILKNNLLTTLGHVKSKTTLMFYWINCIVQIHDVLVLNISWFIFYK